MPIEDLIDCYVGVEDDLRELAHGGEIICVKNAETGADVYYSRGLTFFVDLSGAATVEAGRYLVHSSQDITNELRRGDALRVGDKWFRVSAAVKVCLDSCSHVYARYRCKVLLNECAIRRRARHARFPSRVWRREACRRHAIRTSPRRSSTLAPIWHQIVLSVIT
jgi:hypothetical protein